MSQSITFSISASTLFTAGFITVLGIMIAAIIKPTIYIIRDTLVWGIIDKKIASQKTIEDIDTLERYKKRIDGQFKHPASVKDGVDGELIMFIGDYVAEPHEVYAHEKIRKHINLKIKSLSTSIYNKERRIDSILRHLELKDFKNPITEQCEACVNIYGQKPPINIGLSNLVDEGKINAMIDIWL